MTGVVLAQQASDYRPDAPAEWCRECHRFAVRPSAHQCEGSRS